MVKGLRTCLISLTRMDSLINTPITPIRFLIRMKEQLFTRGIPIPQQTTLAIIIAISLMVIEI